MQLFVLSLMFAHNRWGSTADLPYASDALALLDQLQNKEAHNGGVVMGIGSAFEAESHLVREEPTLANAGYTTRSALQMPAAYWYWGQATGNPFWSGCRQRVTRAPREGRRCRHRPVADAQLLRWHTGRGLARLHPAGLSDSAQLGARRALAQRRSGPGSGHARQPRARFLLRPRHRHVRTNLHHRWHSRSRPIARRH